jgi:hypothetical protein
VFAIRCFRGGNRPQEPDTAKAASPDGADESTDYDEGTVCRDRPVVTAVMRIRVDRPQKRTSLSGSLSLAGKMPDFDSSQMGALSRIGPPWPKYNKEEVRKAVGGTTAQVGDSTTQRAGKLHLA